MKKYLNIFSALFILAGVLSCTDLEEKPVSLLAPETFFTSVKDVETAVLGSYSFIASEGFYGRRLTLSLQLSSDMCDIGDRSTPARRQQVNDFNMDANNGMVTSIWPRGYQAVGAANAAIAGAEQVGEPVEKINELIAEARFVRAFIYYHFVRLFGDIPYIDRVFSDPVEALTVSKTPAEEVYTHIIDDLTFAKENLPDHQPGDIRTRPTKGTAAAYLASVYLTQKNYQDAYDEAKWVIDNKDRFGYQLMPDFQDLFIAENADGLKEHLFAIDFAGNLSSGSLNQDWLGPVTGPRGYENSTGAEGWSVSVPSFAVYDTWDARDYRRKVSFIDSGYVDGVWSGYDKFAPNHGSARPHIAKYFLHCGQSRGDCGVSDNNYVAMRYAEVLLIAAEALNEIDGPETEILGYINQVRARARNWAGTPTNFPEDVPAGLGKDAFRDVVVEERRLELAFEFKRWYDIKRLDMGNEVFKGPNSLEPHPDFDPKTHYLYPLPDDELTRNENLKPQNPGY